MYLIAHTTRSDGRTGVDVDRWYAYETRREAESAYQDLILREDTYSASICKVVKSTDFPSEVETQEAP